MRMIGIEVLGLILSIRKEKSGADPSAFKPISQRFYFNDGSMNIDCAKYRTHWIPILIIIQLRKHFPCDSLLHQSLLYGVFGRLVFSRPKFRVKSLNFIGKRSGIFSRNQEPRLDDGEFVREPPVIDVFHYPAPRITLPSPVPSCVNETTVPALRMLSKKSAHHAIMATRSSQYSPRA